MIPGNWRGLWIQSQSSAVPVKPKGHVRKLVEKEGTQSRDAGQEVGHPFLLICGVKRQPLDRIHSPGPKRGCRDRFQLVQRCDEGGRVGVVEVEDREKGFEVMLSI